MIRRRTCLTTLAAFCAAPALRAQEPTALEKIRKRGSLSVGLYNEMPPFHAAGNAAAPSRAAAVASHARRPRRPCSSCIVWSPVGGPWWVQSGFSRRVSR